MKCNLLLAVVFVLSSLPCWGGTPASREAGWQAFTADFLSTDGRIIDRINAEVSHSEGQGYAMLLAVEHGDRERFTLLWNWTRNNLQVRKSDHLLAWKWGKRSSGQWGVVDFNNATDGDLLAAWALLRAGTLWNQPEWLETAKILAADILKHLGSSWHERALLLPGYFGFTHEDGTAFNPSYLVFPAFQAFAAAWPEQQQAWRNLFVDGLALLASCSFTPLTLPADWVMLPAGKGKNAEVDTDRSPWFGYDAVRLPLYLALAGEHRSLQPYRPLLDLIERVGYVPRQIDLTRGTIHLDAAPAGFVAVMARTAEILDRQDQADRLRRAAADTVKAEKTDYFSRVLYLLAHSTLQSLPEH